MSGVRLAVPNDSGGIVQVLRSSSPGHLLPYTILGAEGIEHYFGDLIAVQQHGGNSLFVVYDEGRGAMGVAEFRRSPDRLFLNHIYVSPALRGKGVGTRLLLTGIEQSRDRGQSQFALDVFADNHRARQWYESLGLTFALEQLWLEGPLAAPGSSDGHWWSLLDFPQANTVHAAYGFSQFRLQTTRGTYSIGRIGSLLFRSTEPEMLADGSAIAALRHLDGARRLLLLVERADWVEEQGLPLTIVTRSHRFTGTTEGVLSNLMRNTNESTA